MSVAISGVEAFGRGQAPGCVALSWVIQNQSEQRWDQEVILKNHCSDDAIVKPMIIKFSL
jgi:hypothetical protein